jgi:membrane fusion protein
VSIFRQESLDQRRLKVYHYLHNGNYSLTILKWIAASVFALLTLSVFFVSFDKHVSAVGFISPDAGVISIRPPINGTVTSLNVREYEQVKRGQILFSVETEGTDQAGSALQLTRENIIARKYLVSQKKDYINNTKKRAQELAAQELRQVVNERNTIEEVIKNQIALTRISKGNMDRYKKLLDQTDITTEEYEAKLTQHMRDLAALTTSQRELNTVDLKAVQVNRQLSMTLIDADSQLVEASIEENLLDAAETKAHTDVVKRVKSPRDGIISYINLVEGATTNTSDLAITLLPNSASIIVELYISSKNIGNVAIGQAVKIIPSTYFDGHKVTIKGKVHSISNFPLASNDLPKIIPLIEHPDPMFRVRVLIMNSGNQGGAATYLRPGVAVTGEVSIEARSAISWITHLLKAE